jgi:hypothetical protein
MIHAVVKAALQTPAIVALVGDRVYPTTFVQKDGGLPRWPAMRYQVIDAVNAATICGTDDQSTDDTRVQVDIVADTMRECYDIVPLVIASMQSTVPPSSRDMVRDTFDEQTRTHRVIVDFVFNASSVEASP